MGEDGVTGLEQQVQLIVAEEGKYWPVKFIYDRKGPGGLIKIDKEILPHELSALGASKPIILETLISVDASKRLSMGKRDEMTQEQINAVYQQQYDAHVAETRARLLPQVLEQAIAHATKVGATHVALETTILVDQTHAGWSSDDYAGKLYANAQAYVRNTR